jgi:hypothetical protein
MGSSGQKRRGRTHLPKVGTPAEEAYALRQARRDVVGNFGIRSRGPIFWVAVVVIAAVVIVGVVALASL